MIFSEKSNSIRTYFKTLNVCFWPLSAGYGYEACWSSSMKMTGQVECKRAVKSVQLPMLAVRISMKRTLKGAIDAGELLMRKAMEALRCYHKAGSTGEPPEEVERLRLLAESLYQAFSDYQQRSIVGFALCIEAFSFGSSNAVIDGLPGRMKKYMVCCRSPEGVC
jgi:hypothetical protein